jgi:outer membrane protein OmpA-like peptidoglycan-associated protein
METRRMRRRWSVVARGAFAATIALAAPLTPALQPDQVTIDRMRLASERGGVLSVESGRVLPHLEMAGGSWLGYANDPLVLHRLGDPSTRAASLIGDRSSGSVSAVVGFLDRAQVAMEIPVVFHQSPVSGAVRPSSVDAFGFGSIRLVPKVRLLDADRHGVDLAVLAALNVPTGAHDFVGSELALQPEIAASRTFRDVRLAGNLGATVREGTTLHDAKMGSELSAQLGAAYDLKPRWSLPLETGLVLATAVSASNPFGRSNETSMELRGYGAFDPTPNVRLLAGAGAGLESGWGTPDWRIFTGAQFALRSKPVAVPAKLVAAPPPEAVPQPEPVASTEPEPVVVADTDGDGLIDPDDRCPTVLGPVENGGCPDTDRDGDGLADRNDDCPDLPGPVENRGCRPAATVKYEDKAIQFKGTIHFATASDVIQRHSFELLDGISTVIKAHPEIARIRVEGHTDSRGGAAYNKTLSERRAKSVVRALVERGVPASSFDAAGFGLERPVADDATSAGRAQNRRVELHVTDTHAVGTNAAGSLP